MRPRRVYSLELTPSKSSYRVLTSDDCEVHYQIFWPHKKDEAGYIGRAFKREITFDLSTRESHRITKECSIVEATYAILVACVYILQARGIIADEEAGLAISRIYSIKENSNGQVYHMRLVVKFPTTSVG